MKYLAVTIIFWLAIWTCPKGAAWWWRVLIVLWALWLQKKMLKDKG